MADVSDEQHWYHAYLADSRTSIGKMPSFETHFSCPHRIECSNRCTQFLFRSRGKTVCLGFGACPANAVRMKTSPWVSSDGQEAMSQTLFIPLPNSERSDHLLREKPRNLFIHSCLNLKVSSTRLHSLPTIADNSLPLQVQYIEAYKDCNRTTLTCLQHHGRTQHNSVSEDLHSI